MEFHGKEPLFRQIASYYRRMILIGALKNGDPMPSVREVALDRGINPNTVQRAFSLLEEEGYIATIAKKGSFVSYGKEPAKRNEILIHHLRDILTAGYSFQEIEKALALLKEEA